MHLEPPRLPLMVGLALMLMGLL
jgi:hypothetical protein